MLRRMSKQWLLYSQKNNVKHPKSINLQVYLIFSGLKSLFTKVKNWQKWSSIQTL